MHLGVLDRIPDYHGLLSFHGTFLPGFRAVNRVKRRDRRARRAQRKSDLRRSFVGAAFSALSALSLFL